MDELFTLFKGLSREDRIKFAQRCFAYNLGQVFADIGLTLQGHVRQEDTAHGAVPQPAKPTKDLLGHES